MKKSNTTSNFTDKEGVINYSTDVNYWDEKRGKYRIFSGKDKISIYRNTGLIEAFGDKFEELGRLFKLINSMDSNNMIGICDKHLKHYYPVTSKQMLYDLLGIKSRTTGVSFFKKLKKIELLKEWHNDDGKTVFYISPIYTMADRGITLTVYKLFFVELNKVLPYKARMALQALCSNLSADNSQVVTWDKGDNIFVDGVLYDDQMESADEKMNIFNEYILHDQAPKTYQIIGGGMVAHPMTKDNDTYFLVNQTADYKTTKPKNEEITEYRSWFLDIDCGKDESGNYFDLEEVARRKVDIMKVIHALPIPTAIVSTRNGYHIYYACYGVDKAESWQTLEDKLISITMIADPAVRDAARVLRLPGSMWIKSHTGLEPYPVTIIVANRQAYDVESFRRQLNACKDKVQTAANNYISMYPAPYRFGSKMAATALHVANLTDRIQAIMDLSCDTFMKSETQEVDNINDYLHNQVNLAEFLQVENPNSFCCILHDDHHPSASIYKNDKGYKYICASAACVGHGDGHGIDIIDVVRILAGCTYRQAINYLCRIYSIKQAAKAAA